MANEESPLLNRLKMLTVCMAKEKVGTASKLSSWAISMSSHSPGSHPHLSSGGAGISHKPGGSGELSGKPRGLLYKLLHLVP